MALILTVDDSSFMRNRIAAIVKADGHEVLEAENGLKGLQKALSERPDCILLDLIMPVVNGVKFLNTLREKQVAIPVIVVTADVQKSVRQQCLQLGVSAFINKPPKSSELLGAIKDALEAPKKAPMELTAAQLDALKELINIGIGRAAGVLNDMVNSHVSLQVPQVRILSHETLLREMNELGRGRVAAVRLVFKGPFAGTAALVFPPDSASKLVAVLTGEEPGSPSLDAVRAGTLSEVGNILINGVMGSIGNVLEQRIDYSLPSYLEDTIDRLLGSGRGPRTTVLLVRTRFMVREHRVEGNIILLFEVGSFDALVEAIDREAGTAG